MSIDPVAPSRHPNVLLAKPSAAADKHATPGHEKTSDSSAPATSPADTPEQPDQAKGVLRLLQAGHFRGVADVRLRINFFDELSARAAADARQAAQTGAADLVSAVNAKIDELTLSLAISQDLAPAVAELATAFEESVRASLDTCLAAETPDTNALADSLRSAFQTLVEGLRTALAPQPDPSEPPADTAPAGTTEPPPGETPAPDAPAIDLEAALTSFTTAFNEGLAAMLDAMATRATLPDPAPPVHPNNAYDKFLRIYNELRGLGPTTTPPDSAPLEEVG